MIAPNQPSAIVIQEDKWNELSLHEKRVIHGLTLRGLLGSMFRIRIVEAAENPRMLTVRENGKILAWMAIFPQTPVSRCVYFFTRKSARRKGYGQLLQHKLIDIAQNEIKLEEPDQWAEELLRENGRELEVEFILRPWDSASRAFFAQLLDKAREAGVTNIRAIPSL